MRYKIATKFLAFFLATCALAATLVCGGYALLLNQYGLYDSSPDEKMEQWYYDTGNTIAWPAVAKRTSQILGGCTAGLADHLYVFPAIDEDYYYVTIHQDGTDIPVVGEPIADGITYQYDIKPQYYKLLRVQPAYVPSTPDPEPSEGMMENPQATAPNDTDREPDYDKRVDILEDGQQLIYEVKECDDSPTYSVSVTMSREVLRQTFHSNMIAVYPQRYTLIWSAAATLIVAIAATVYLICAAGHTTDGKIRPGGLNLLPMDVYLAGVGVSIYFLANQMWIIYASNNGLNFLMVSILVLLGVTIGILVLAVIYAMAAQFKVGKGHWWRHSVLGTCALALWKGCCALLRMMHVIWQWIVISLVLIGITVVSLIFMLQSYHIIWIILFVLSCFACISVVAYGSYCFALILTGARKMSQGELTHKIPTESMRGSFKACAEQMNALSETTMQAVQSQVRAERMKTELITNVSHDIKTPLTSIINFVDLLGKPHSKEADDQYLEILSRQSQQLKKLIEDLMELSKASSGNLQATIIPLDATESVNQALGEFSDKLERANLTPVFYPPEEPVLIAADGRMTWRVLSNLLSNAVKYATPGTRVHVEILREADKVLLSIKNVSREELRLSAEDLLERFVRGDASRNREGSGLGLNIAKSLMEVQHGSLQLTLDGDLFKVTLTFPAAQQ